MATTPVAALMFRFNNPDALLALCLVITTYFVVRALEDGRTRWLVLAGVLVGAGFLTKLGQALLVVPGFGLVYLCCAPVALRRRIGQLAAAGAAIVVTAGWWVAAVTLIPAANRPYVGGSTDNSVLNMIFGYNGFGRLTGNEAGSVVAGGGTGHAGLWGPTGLTRLFGSDMGSQVSWLLPAALLLTVAVLWLIRRSPRTDTARAQILLWASWLVVTGLTFSLGKGIIHPYYTVALAPAIGALIGIGGVALWRSRARQFSRLVLAVTVAGTAVWAHRLMARSPDFHPWLRGVVLIVGLVVAVALLVPPGRWGRLTRWASVVAVASLVVGLTGPLAWALDTAKTPHTGAIPSAGPAVTVASGGGPGGARGGFGRPGGHFGGGRGFQAPRGFGNGGQPPGGRSLFGPGGPLGLGARRRREPDPGRHAQRRDHRSTACKRLVVQLGRRDGRRGECGGLSARGLRTGDGYRWLQRDRSRAHTRPVRARRRAGPHPLLHREWSYGVRWVRGRWVRGRWWLHVRRGRRQPDRAVGRHAFHRQDHRRDNGLRPDADNRYDGVGSQHDLTRYPS